MSESMYRGVKRLVEGNEYLPGSQNIFRGRPNISVGQPILVQPKYNPT